MTSALSSSAALTVFSHSVRQAVVPSAAKLNLEEKIATQTSRGKFTRKKTRVDLHMGAPSGSAVRSPVISHVPPAQPEA